MIPVSSQSFPHLDLSEKERVFINLNSMKQYQSQFHEISLAIDSLSKTPIEQMHSHAPSVLQTFNQQIANAKQIANYHENISTLEQLDTLEERLIGVEFGLKQLSGYESNFGYINKVIKVVLQHVRIGNTVEIIRKLNTQLAAVKQIADYHENISTLEQLDGLERQLLKVECNLKQISKYQSRFSCIAKAISKIPQCVRISKALEVIRKLNVQLATVKKIADYNENISTLEQLDTLEERLIIMEFDLGQIRKYQSRYEEIHKAIKKIPKCIHIEDILNAIEYFNVQIAYCKGIAYYNQNIRNEQQIIDLENRLDACKQSLGKLWSALYIENKPCFNEIFLMRKWFDCVRNQPLLDQITTLKLIDCNISLLPIELLTLRNLQELDLSMNKILVIPDWISAFAVLKILDLSCNKSENFPKGFAQCVSVEILNMSNSQIKEFPTEVLQLTNLKELDLSMNEITSLPSSIYRCTALETLNLSYNKLKELPIELCLCFKLQKLDISYNLIEDLIIGVSILTKKNLYRDRSVYPEQLKIMSS